MIVSSKDRRKQSFSYSNLEKHSTNAFLQTFLVKVAKAIKRNPQKTRIEHLQLWAIMPKNAAQAGKTTINVS